VISWLKDPEPRARPQILGKLAWKPFDLRFADILENIDNHGKVINFELQISETEQASEARREASEERVRTEECRIGTDYPGMHD
jgi:hypothetical protein